MENEGCPDRPKNMSATGVVPKNLLENLKHLGFNEHLYKTMPKAVLLGNAQKFMEDTNLVVRQKTLKKKRTMKN